MAAIKTNLGYLNYYEKGEAITTEKMQVMYLSDTDFQKGTIQTPFKIFTSNNGYLEIFWWADRRNLNMHHMTGSELGDAGVYFTNSTPHPLPITIYAYVNDAERLSVVWRSLTPEQCAAYPYAYTSDNILYINDLSEAEDDIIERVWDERAETEDNPNGLNPDGGFFADTDPFDMTYLQETDSIPDPEDDPGLDYSGFITCYSLESGDLSTLATTFFSPTVWSELKGKLDGLANPLDYIISAVELPFPTATGAKPFKLAGVQVGEGNYGVSAKRGLQIHLGSVTLKEVWGTAVDYSNTSVQIFLPYVGVKELDTDLIVNNTVTLYANVDTWTGDVLYLLHTSNTNSKSKYFRQESVPYRWTGNCGRQVPISRTSQNVSGMIGSLSAVVGGAAAATVGAVTANPLMLTGGFASVMTGMTKQATGGTAPIVQSSGQLSGVTGSYDYQYPYLIVKRAVPQYPRGYEPNIAHPEYETYRIVDLHGLTRFHAIHIEGTSATEAEKAAIETALTEGVIL